MSADICWNSLESLVRSAPKYTSDYSSTSEYLEEYFDHDDLDPARGGHRTREGAMPAHNANSEIRGRHRSKAFSRRTSNRPDGMHRRRIRKMD